MKFFLHFGTENWEEQWNISHPTNKHWDMTGFHRWSWPHWMIKCAKRWIHLTILFPLLSESSKFFLKWVFIWKGWHYSKGQLRQNVGGQHQEGVVRSLHQQVFIKMMLNFQYLFLQEWMSPMWTTLWRQRTRRKKGGASIFTRVGRLEHNFYNPDFHQCFLKRLRVLKTRTRHCQGLEWGAPSEV